MLEKIRWIPNECPKDACEPLKLMAAAELKKVRDFHKSIPQYEPTPLAKLPNLSALLGIKGAYVKDESYRFGLNAFKVLGGAYAIAKYVASLVGCDVSELPYQKLTSQELRDKIGQVTFFTATDGNHGRGVAWAANKLGQKSVIFMPRGSTQQRLEAIRAEGATASIIEGGYTDAVRMATAESKKVKNSVVVQDTAWPGYEEIPSWIMQGYGTMAMEADEQLSAIGVKPTHVIIQAGVGSVAGAVQGYFTTTYGDSCPVVATVEADATDCLYQSGLAKSYRAVDEGTTIMAGLNCGEPNTVSWEIIKNHTNFFVSAPDWVSAKGMRILTAPLRGDDRVISGESGAVGLGLLASTMLNADMADFKNAMGLDENSVVLLFSTEGDTDDQTYRDIVWDGDYPSLG